MRQIRSLILFALAFLLIGAVSQAAFIIEVDTDGLDDGVLTYSPNFGFGGDTTTASQSAASSAVGMTGGDSIYGGNGSALVDTYLYSYDLSVDGDNLPLTAGTSLNAAGDVASGKTAGISGNYTVYSTWPFTQNVSGGLTTFTLTDDLSNTVFSVQIDQNNGGAGSGNEWILLGSGNLDSARTYTLTQTAGSNTFVSMRAAGVLFDVTVPEPASLLLLGLAGVLGGCLRSWR